MSVYPGAIPSSGDLPDAGANLSSNPHSSLHDDVRDEVIAIATELGVEPSGTEATVRARLDQGLGLREIVTFTADGTFTKASYPWLRAIKVTCVGGGGAGGGVSDTIAGTCVSGGGGGGAGSSVRLIPATSLSASEGVLVGDGGAGVTNAAGNAGTQTSFALGAAYEVIALGGGGGSTRGRSSGFRTAAGGFEAGVGAAAGDLVFGGQSGGFGVFDGSQNEAMGGTGGSSAFGGGANPGAGFQSNDGRPGIQFGAGGSGASNQASQTSARAGGTGANGVVIVELYA